MNVYTCNSFIGHYPVGTAAVVVAESQEHAAEALNQHLLADGLMGEVACCDMIPVNQQEARVFILRDGNY